ncbi:hypothetical protein Hamer_G027650, partial [Homarus americanus]
IVRLRGERLTEVNVWLVENSSKQTPHKVKHFHSAIGVQCPDCQHLVSKILTVLYLHLLYIYNTFKLIVSMQSKMFFTVMADEFQNEHDARSLGKVVKILCPRRP